MSQGSKFNIIYKSDDGTIGRFLLKPWNPHDIIRFHVPFIPHLSIEYITIVVTSLIRLGRHPPPNQWNTHYFEEIPRNRKRSEINTLLFIYTSPRTIAILRSKLLGTERHILYSRIFFQSTHVTILMVMHNIPVQLDNYYLIFVETQRIFLHKPILLTNEHG